jgi:hypothetical protein
MREILRDLFSWAGWLRTSDHNPYIVNQRVMCIPEGTLSEWLAGFLIDTEADVCGQLFAWSAPQSAFGGSLERSAATSLRRPGGG